MEINSIMASNYQTKKLNQRNKQQISDFSEKIGKFKRFVKEDPNKPVAHKTAVTDWKGDGVDHININSNGVTNIGRFLSHDNNYGFVHPKLGRFASSRSFWLWLKSKERDDRLRTKVGAAAYNIFKNCSYRNVPNSRAIMLESDYQKLLQYPAAVDELISNDLPLDNYFFDRDSELKIPRRPSNYYWLVEGWEEIRRAIKEKREPDFTKWLDVKDSGIYDYVFSEDGSLPTVIGKDQSENRTRKFRNSVMNKPKSEDIGIRSNVDTNKLTVISKEQDEIKVTEENKSSLYEVDTVYQESVVTLDNTHLKGEGDENTEDTQSVTNDVNWGPDKANVGIVSFTVSDCDVSLTKEQMREDVYATVEEKDPIDIKEVIEASSIDSEAENALTLALKAAINK